MALPTRQAHTFQRTCLHCLSLEDVAQPHLQNHICDLHRLHTFMTEACITNPAYGSVPQLGVAHTNLLKQLGDDLLEALHHHGVGRGRPLLLAHHIVRRVLQLGAQRRGRL